MRGYPSFFLLFVLLCSECITGMAQLYFPNKNITTAQGLSDNRITCFYKDKTGFFWIGTNNGLNQYNGHAFTVYKPAKANAVSNEIITDVTGDDAGNIWVATMNGLNKWERATQQWKLWLPNQPDTKRDLPNSLVWDIAFDNKGLLWIASDVFEFSSFDEASNTFTYYDWRAFVKTISGKKTAPGYHAIQRFVQKNDYEFWLGSNKGLVHLNTATKKFTYIGGGYNADVMAIHWDAEKKEVLLSVKGGLFFTFNEIQQQYKAVQPVQDFFPSTTLPKAKGNYNLLIPSSDGLIYQSNGSNLFSKTTQVPGLKASLPTGGVTTVYDDGKGLHWIGTSNGIYIVDDGAMNTAFLPLVKPDPSASINQISSVYYSKHDSLYFVSTVRPAAMFTINQRTGQIKKITQDNRGRPLDTCLMVKGAGNHIWLLTERFVYRYDAATAGLTHVPTPYDGKRVGYRDVAVDAKGNTWWASFYEGVFYYDVQLRQYKRVIGERDNFLNDVATALQPDTSGNTMWMGSYGRYLHAYHVVQKKLIGFDEFMGGDRFQSLNLIHDIETDIAGNIWIATNAGGIFKNNNNLSSPAAFLQYNMQSGLSNNQFLSLAVGNKNRLWLLSGKGLSWLDMTANTPVEHTVRDVFGFSGTGFDPAIPRQIFYGHAADEVLVPMANGVLFHYPFVNAVVTPFPLLLVMHHSGQDTARLSAVEQHYQLSHQQHDLHFSFAGLYYGLAAITYRYKLEGYDDDWQLADNDRLEATYKKLPANAYTFTVQALDQYGKVIVESQSIHIRLAPPFWLQWWFVSAVVAISIVLLYCLARIIRQRLSDEKMLTSFATSLYGKNNIDDISQQVAQLCVRYLLVEVCHIYQYDASNTLLRPVASASIYGTINKDVMIQPKELLIGEGVAGTVAETGVAKRMAGEAQSTTQSTAAVLAVPVQADGRLLGVIEATHQRSRFFTKRHERLMQRIASFMAARVEKYMTEEKIRSNIARDLHDEMGSTLTSINILSKVAMAPNRQSSEIHHHLQKIKDHSSSMMESMSDMVWAINPANDSMEKMVVHMREFAVEILEPAGIRFSMELRGHVHTVLLNIQERKDLYLIFKEAVNNAVKYSGAAEMTIVIEHMHNQLLMQVADNGYGFNLNDASQGNGLKNMEARAKAIGASLSITSAPGKGTVVSITKPLT